jgi:hypothetical protein
MQEKHYLTPLFEPKSVAIIGASEREGSIGAVIVRNMLEAGYKGKLFAVSWTLHEVYELDPTGKEEPRSFGVASHFTNLDGIEVLEDGSFLVSDFTGNKLAVIAPDRKTVRVLKEIESPADIGLDRVRSLLYVPQFMKNRVAVFKLERK